MSKEATGSGPIKRSARSFLENVFPRAVRVKYMGYLEDSPRPLARRLPEWALTFVSAYQTQAIHAFNKYGNLALAGVVFFSFATAPAWPAPFTALMVVLLAFVIRDAYIYGQENYPTDGITDAALALIFLLADETLTLQWAPALAMPKAVFFKGAAACLPLLVMFRMLSRPLPQPDPNTPLWPGMPPERIYWRMARLNVLWIFMFYFSIAMFEVDGPSKIDVLRGFLPGMMFATWIAVQTNRLARRNFIEQLNTDPRRLRLSRMVETLPQGLKSGDPLYYWYIALESLIFLMGGANIGVELWKWLYGEAQSGWWRISTSLIAFVVAVVAWRYVKAANRAAVAAIRAAMSFAQEA